MRSGVNDLVASLRAGLVEEAQDARRLAARIRGLDFQEVEGLPPIRDLERQLDEYARHLGVVGAALERADAEAPGTPDLMEAWKQARAASAASWGALTRALEAIAASLEAEQGARALDRMRLVEGLRALARESEEEARLVARIAELDNGMRVREADIGARTDRMRAETDRVRAELAEARGQIEARDASLEQSTSEVARLQAILAEDGHRLVTRVGAMLARHPILAAIARAPVRLFSRLLNRSRP